MKYLNLSIFLLVLVIIQSNSTHSQVFNDDDMFISVGYGYTAFNPVSLFSEYEDDEDFSTGILGPINIQFESALSEDIGLGIDIGYSNAFVQWTEQAQRLNETTNEFEDVVYNYDYNRTKLTINLRGNYHLAKDERLDPYFGFGMGFKTANWKLDSNNEDFDGLDFDTFIPVSLLLRFGCRFMFSDNVGAYIEGGAGHGLFQGGLTVKL